MSDSMIDVPAIPDLAFPPHWSVPQSLDEAKQRYRGWELKLGVNSDGEVGVRLDRTPHLLVVGGTGSGKGALVRSWLEQFRASLWTLILASDTGTGIAGYLSDGRSGSGLPAAGVVAHGLGTSPAGMSFVGSIVTAHRIMQDRQRVAVDAKWADPEGWDQYAPVVLVLDDIGVMRRKWGAQLPRAEQRAIESMITEILVLGRELRVHVVLVSQDARDVSVPATWSSNLLVKIAAARFSEMTAAKIFPDTDRHAARLAKNVGANGAGAFVASITDPNTGESRVEVLRSYLSYAPGCSWSNPALPSACAEHWPPFAAAVSDRVPRVYSRLGFKVEEPPDGETVDFDQFTVAELQALELVTLDMRGSSGKIVAAPEMAKYDPLSGHYVCRADDAGRARVPVFEI
ncbi:hypothetical protein H7J07_05680 [Mycobacterium koreense]|uniref:Uncharacterized protein n=1 Tax=Mycolicibacillus koreensis TaxID=1069220 RepID=A0A7I7SC81_9MYCO|nr:hypothetical protein [Mycolicibacillus koreensis]MCV7247715.1 hypothetical protein [Mycolicibacillus koreensis]OSC34754.1 hypothetical protein B8W67_05765 [Mycolicibacillus koreensis]BBY54100.1 hypothetical protein MKOR_13510 [Mycolicibacillus koreensis]